MPKFYAMSDLHQEFARDPDWRISWPQKFLIPNYLPNDIDAVILAGDINVDAVASLDWIAQNLPERQVIFVCGNHEFYQFPNEEQPEKLPFLTHSEILSKARFRAAELGILLLENDTIEVAGVRLIGATLWTDFRSVLPRPINEKIAIARGRNGMNDYRRIKRPSQKKPGQRRNLRPLDTIEMHLESRHYIWDQLAVPHDGPTMVVSHHAPHPASLGKPASGGLDFCYASDLSEILLSERAPDVWIHGHIHHSSDYRIGRTRIVANPYGYAFGRGHSSSFDPAFVLEI